MAQVAGRVVGPMEMVVRVAAVMVAAVQEEVG